MRNIKTMVKDKVVRFKFYREGELFYETECGFVFQVPLADVGNATFMAEDKALLFMPYGVNIRFLSKICGSLVAWVVFQVHDIKRLLRRDRYENHKNFS